MVVQRHYVDNTAEFSSKGSSAGMVMRQKVPKNLEAPFDRIDFYLTPTELFYIWSHFPTPHLDRGSYKLCINGAVRHPLALSYDELRNTRSETRVATLECAGNSRVLSSRRHKAHSGDLEQLGMRNGPVCPCECYWSVPAWQKTLARSSLKERIAGRPQNSPFLPTHSRHARSLPEVLITYQMSGCDPPRDHGFPVRSIVPVHYAMASVKWLTGILVVDEPLHGYWQTSDCAHWLRWMESRCGARWER